MKSMYILVAIFSLTASAVAAGACPAGRDPKGTCCTPRTCCNPNQYCPIDLVPNRDPLHLASLEPLSARR